MLTALPNPLSPSAITGIRTARTMRAVQASMSSNEISE
ncbi:Uncharacterised protein [Mycobacteroides abscessus subsp. abscessus]|nr:Uncharacterised protein [Mycobacteroides abscessus subsp. abscessus]